MDRDYKTKINSWDKEIPIMKIFQRDTLFAAAADCPTAGDFGGHKVVRYGHYFVKNQILILNW